MTTAAGVLDVSPVIGAREPDFDNLLAVLRGEEPSRPTLFEFFMNGPLQERITGQRGPEKLGVEHLRWLVEAFRAVGYDHVTYPGSTFNFPAGERHSASSVSLNEGGVIGSWEDFEKLEWTEPGDCDYSALELIGPDLPGNMKVISQGPCGVLENLIRLVGFDRLCYMLADDPDLARAITDAVGSRLVKHYEILCSFDAVGACIANDDWGFKTQTMLSPAWMRELVIPWHRKIVETVHASGRPVILHSCGMLREVEPDILDVGFDGKHSYEDGIEPVEQAYERLRGKIAVMGGIDVDFVCRAPAEDVYRRSKAMLERTRGRGGYALGTGNSVPHWVPEEKFFAMTRAALE